MILIINNTIYTVKLVESETNSNYNIFASVFKDAEKLPMFGKSFKKDDTSKELLKWAKNGIENYTNNQTL